jgi:hypothetical protein
MRKITTGELCMSELNSLLISSDHQHRKATEKYFSDLEKGTEQHEFAV